MLDWNDLGCFLAIFRTGTLTGAAGLLGVNATTVGRRLAALEEQMGTRLFDRTPEGYAPTQAGRELLPHAERMETEALAIEREIAGADQRAIGVVRLATTEMLATRFLGPHLPAFHEAHPDITLDLTCATRPVLLGRREADVTVRLSRPHEDDVVARRLTTVDLSLYAARAYLERHGRPKDADQNLAGHRVLLFAESRAFALENAWLAPRVEGARVVMRSDSVSSIYSVTVAGAGIALLPRIVADAEPLLERLPTRSAPEPRVIWQGVHRDLLGSARIRAVLAFLARVVVAEG